MSYYNPITGELYDTLPEGTIPIGLLPDGTYIIILDNLAIRVSKDDPRVPKVASESLTDLQSRFETKDINQEAIDKLINKGYGTNAWIKLGATLGAGALGAAGTVFAWPFIGDAVLTGLNMYGGYEGLLGHNGLLTSNGIRKTFRKFKNKDYEGAGWSLLGDAANAFMIPGAWSASNKLFNTGIKFGNDKYKLGIGIYGAPKGVATSGIPGPIMSKVEYLDFIKDRLPYYEIPYETSKRLPPRDNIKLIISPNLSIYGPRRSVITTEAMWPRTNDNFNLLELLNLQHNYGLDLSAFPRTHYEYNSRFRIFEEPIAGPKNLPLVHNRSNSNDVMYANAHRMWNELSPDIKKKLTNIFTRVFKRYPNSLYSPESRAFAISKEIQSAINNKFVTDYRLNFKDYPEYLEFIDDMITEERLANAIKKVHGGYWYNNGYIDTSDKSLDAFYNSIKYKNGGKFRKTVK